MSVVAVSRRLNWCFHRLVSFLCFQYRIFSFIIVSFVIIGVSYTYSETALYKRPEIPVCEEDIPTQENVDQWPHLGGVFIPHVDCEIGLLIVSDVPETLDPVEIRHSVNGGPYASRTRIG